MENWKERLLEVSFIYTGKDVGVIETITFDYDKLEDFISKELDKAREEGFRRGWKDGVYIASKGYCELSDVEDDLKYYKKELSKLKDNK